MVSLFQTYLNLATRFPTLLSKKMGFFDVVSLFTAIPLDKACSYIQEKSMNDETFSYGTKLDVDDIISLLNLLLSNNFYIFNHIAYKQVHGCAINPVSAILAITCAWKSSKRFKKKKHLQSLPFIIHLIPLSLTLISQ